MYLYGNINLSKERELWEQVKQDNTSYINNELIVKLLYVIYLMVMNRKSF